MKSLTKTLTNNLECSTNYVQLLLNEECKEQAKQRQEAINGEGSFCICTEHFLFRKGEEIC